MTNKLMARNEAYYIVFNTKHSGVEVQLTMNK